MQAQIVEDLGKDDFEAPFAAICRANTESILLPPDGLIIANRESIAGFARTLRLPLVVVGSGISLPASGPVAFGPGRAEYAQMAARCIDQILKAAEPRGLPIEQPIRFELVIDRQTAKELGLTIPQTLVLRASSLIQ